MFGLFESKQSNAPKEKTPLLYFYGVECTHCDLMEPLMKQLEDDTGMTLRKFEVWYNDDNLRLLQRLDKDGVCNGVPFFYSKMKRDWICGATTYPNFKAWATGKPHERFLSPPTEDSEVMGQFKGVFDRIRNTGFDALRKRMEAGKRLAGEENNTTSSTTPNSNNGNNNNNNNSKQAISAPTKAGGAFASYTGVLIPNNSNVTKCSRRLTRQ